MEPKRTILVVEDEGDYHDLMRPNFTRYFPGNQYDLVFAHNFMQGAEVLCDPNQSVAGVVIDNGFPLSDGGERKGASYKITRESYDEMLAHIREGSAGSMLLRFIRSGDPQAQSQESQADLAGLPEKVEAWLGAQKDSHLASLKNIPVIWNSAHPAVGKLHEVAAASAGQLASPDNPNISNETIAIRNNEIVDVGNNTWCSDKTFKKIFDCLSRTLGVERKEAAPTYTLRSLATVRPSPSSGIP